MANSNCRISDAEWLVMKALWQESPLTASLVIGNLKSDTDWSPKTIPTLIARLVKKGALGVNKESSLNQYYPIVSQDECMRTETNSFLQRNTDRQLSVS
ncbi:MAG: BlaI/MecI/CopY family transcriptional regulator [Desulfosporosinus sp.]|nr:BlaI/MecI/CopY family transcriptional regulator [Desulfosporosinus sp.]